MPKAKFFASLRVISSQRAYASSRLMPRPDRRHRPAPSGTACAVRGPRVDREHVVAGPLDRVEGCETTAREPGDRHPRPTPEAATERRRRPVQQPPGAVDLVGDSRAERARAAAAARSVSDAPNRSRSSAGR